MEPSTSIVNWNVEWARADWRRVPLLERIHRHAPDVICLTETHCDFPFPTGHSICSRPDYGYPIKKGRRKVMLWSKQPWRHDEDLGIDEPPGRFVSGITETPLGDVTVVGLCIPWFGSRTEKKRGDERKKPWEDHESFLNALREVLKKARRERVIVIGDFNQAIGPGSRAPVRLRGLLQAIFTADIRIVTSDLVYKGKPTIDHIALSADLGVTSMSVLSNLREGKELSDHFGLAAQVSTVG
ncbi:MAG: endonuclease/exonuclease/phosphatase family protein [bacterium]|nr:endonuclease/exonuclease/phosphatase family protein [bacterium]MDE0642826.1 endonuclease/exonuclease/phosphatase family protein [bacterium]